MSELSTLTNNIGHEALREAENMIGNSLGYIIIFILGIYLLGVVYQSYKKIKLNK